MIDIGKHIKEILKYEDSVIIQGLGAFVTSYKSAEVMSKTGTIQPPTKEITFNEKLKEDNGRLVDFISEKENIAKDLVRRELDEFVKTSLQKLQIGQSVNISELGYLYKDKAYKVQFDQETDENILLDTFGLQEIEWDVSDNRAKVDTSKIVVEEKSKRKLLIIPITILVVIILVFSILISENVKSPNQKGSSVFASFFSRESDSDSKNDAISSDIEINIDSITERNNALRFEENKPALIKKFYLIAGSFSIYNNAEMYKDELVLKGYDAEVLEVDGKIFRVSMKAYENKDEARQDLYSLQEQFADRKLWVLTAR